MLVLGLTGNLGVGKTTVARMFEKLGAKVLDADLIAHRLISRRGRCFKKVVRHFGDGILKGGQIDRRKLAATVFNDPRQLKALTRLIHPEVIREIKNQISLWRKKESIPLVVVEAALLIESGLNVHMDHVIVVKANRVVQLKRAMETRGLARKEILERIKMQLPLKKQLQYADIVIDNRGSFNQTKKQVEGIWQELLQTNHGK